MKGRRPKLIVIDDEASICEMVCQVAEIVGYDAESFEKAESFLSSEGAEPDVIVLDLLMPEFDGVEMIRLLASMQHKAALILISGVDKKVLHSAHELALEHGLDLVGSLLKPIELSELQHLLEEVSGHVAEQTLRTVSSADGDGPSIKELHAGIRRGEFVPHYQPQISVADNKVIGFEVLMHWNSRERGLVYPDSFIPLAESSGLIDAMTWQLYEQVAQDWETHGLELNISLNMTAGMFKSLDMPETFTDIGERHGFTDNSRLTLEVTESALMEELTRSLDCLIRLRMKGFHLSIDDFGTGYSSMVQLYRAPFSEMKIDRSFVTRMEKDHEAMTIVESTINLGHSLNMKVVAEGVETATILSKLTDFGCDIVQGYYFARPMPIAEAIAWLQEWESELP